MIYSFPKLLDVVALLFIFYFIWSTLAWFVFKDVGSGEFVTDLANFKNFHFSLITLFRASTGEDW